MKYTPNYTRLAALSTAAILIATPAFAQQSTQKQDSLPAAMEKPQISLDADTKATAPSQSTQKPDSLPDAMEKPQISADADAKATDLKGKQVWSSDGKELGAITMVNLGTNGDVESIHVEVGAFFGLIGKTVKIDAAEFSQKNERVELKMDAEAAKALPKIKA
jgi:sporulation protein YlmC with PRC-barrel domain